MTPTTTAARAPARAAWTTPRLVTLAAGAAENDVSGRDDDGVNLS